MRSTLLLVVFTIAVLMYTANAQLCAYSVLGTKKNLAECSWYNKDLSCCSYDTSVQMREAWKSGAGSFKNATVSQFVKKVATSTVFANCVDKIHQFFCFHCAPNQPMYMGLQLLPPALTVRMCPTYCDSMYNSCKNLPITDDGKLVRQTYSTSEAFCTGFLKDMVKNAVIKVEEPLGLKCFNAGSSTTPAMVVMIIATVIAIAFSLF